MAFFEKKQEENAKPIVGMGADLVKDEDPKLGQNWGAAKAAVLFLLAVGFICTQYTAWIFEFQPALGEALLTVGSEGDPAFKVYLPWQHVLWFIQFWNVPAAVEAARNSMLLSGVLTALTVSYIFLRSLRNAKPDLGNQKSVLHGSAEFADLKTVTATGLLDGAFPLIPTEKALEGWRKRDATLAEAKSNNGGLLPDSLLGMLKGEGEARDDAAVANKPGSDGEFRPYREKNGYWVFSPEMATATFRRAEAKRLKDFSPPPQQKPKPQSKWAKLLRMRIGKVKPVLKPTACLVGGFRHPITKEMLPLVDGGGRHILAYAPTGSGKGVALMLPGLMTYRGSVVVHDVKKENFALTAGVRKHKFGQRILLVEPLADGGISARFNPLAEVRVGTKLEIKDLDMIGIILVKAGSKDEGGNAKYFQESAIDLFRGAALHVLYTQDNANMADVMSLLASKPLDELCEELQTYDHAQGRGFYWTKDARTGEQVHTHPIVREVFMRLATKGDNEKGGVKGSLDTPLSFFADPVVRDNTSVSDFAISDIVNHETPVSMYLVAPPTETAKTGPFFSILVNMMLSKLTEKMEYKNGVSQRAHKHEMCFFLDEFPALAKIPAIVSALGFTRSYGLRFFLVCQDPNQLKASYGDEGRSTIFANCNVRIAMTPNDLETAKLISDYLGDATVTQTDQSYSGKKSKLDNTSISKKEHKRKLLDPSEVMRIPEHNMITFVGGVGACSIFGEKFKYYEDEVFRVWANIPPPPKTERLRLKRAAIDPNLFPSSLTASEIKQIAEKREAELASNKIDFESLPVLDESSLQSMMEGYASDPDSFDLLAPELDEQAFDIDPETGEVLAGQLDNWEVNERSFEPVPERQAERTSLDESSSTEDDDLGSFQALFTKKKRPRG